MNRRTFLQQNRAVTFEYDGEPVKIVYKPQRAMTEFDRNLPDIESPDNFTKRDGIVTLLASCIESWEIPDTPSAPITRASVEAIDLDLCADIFIKLGEDLASLPQILARYPR
jgi:hypothetical protein